MELPLVWRTAGTIWRPVCELLKHVEVDEDDLAKRLLIGASKLGHLVVVRELLNNGKVNANAHDKNGCTSLIWACRVGQLDIVQDLLQRDTVDVNFAQNDNHETALHLACQRGHLEVVRELLKHNLVDVSAATECGKTAPDVGKPTWPFEDCS